MIEIVAALVLIEFRNLLLTNINYLFSMRELF